MFVRLKKIKNKHYAYYVENRRVRGKVRQKVKGYIGRTIIPKKVNDIDFFSFIKSDKNLYSHKSIKDIVFDLVNWELHKHNLDDIKFDKEKGLVMTNKSKIVLKINEGYLYNKTIKDIIRFMPVGDDDYHIGMEYAEVYVKAGIDIPKELFVILFENVTKTHNEPKKIKAI